MNWKEIYDKGYNVVPVWAKNKTPIVEWKQWIDHRQKEHEAATAFRNDHDGIAIICYDGLTCIDFDVKNGSVIDDFFDGLEKHEWLRGDKFPPHWMQTTPSGGLHIVIRCAQRFEKNQPLARTVIESTPKVKYGVLIETRAKGGLFLVYPTEGYVAEEPIPVLDLCTATEYDLLMEYCRGFSSPEADKPEKKEAIKTTAPKSFKVAESGESTFDQFNREYDALELLTNYGWEYLHTQGEYARLSRPDTKSHDVHAVYNTEKNFFYVHTTMDGVFDPGGYTPVQIVCKLMHNNDMSQTGRWIREYYKRPEPLTIPQTDKNISRRELKADPWLDPEIKTFQEAEEVAAITERNGGPVQILAEGVEFKEWKMDRAESGDFEVAFNLTKQESDDDQPYMFSLKNKPEFIATCLDVAHSGCVWGVGAPGNIVTIAGPPKARKTSLITGAVASAFTGGQIFLNMACDIGEKGIVFIDTEQPSNFFWNTISGIYRAVGMTEDSPRFKGAMLRPHSPRRRLYWVEKLLSEGDNGLLILDGSADLCEDVNDSKESSKISQQIMKWTYDYKILLINVIHANKGDKLPRGHIGGELMRKSDTIIGVEMDANSLITTVSCKYSRFGFFKSFHFMHGENGVLDIVSESQVFLNKAEQASISKTWENKYSK